ncbi:choice-of-anchor L domain-containing protein [Epilithonimonas vandammei]|uniref:choice-of-anchor L domain-containing protein n=1 Tax=Epilithonimonas vandammei TaxID=2487072 RepID=UPI002899CB6C|nr:choice-of-anchor L domain-containing protein [Epilithonimonas vandammei]
MKANNLICLFSKFLLLSVVVLPFGSLIAQYISVDTSNNSASQIVAKFLGAGAGCISVSNEKITGWDQNGDYSYGYFDKSNSSFAIDQGIILSTGKAAVAVGPKGSIQSFGSWSGDNDLYNEIHKPTVDATSLEFDFKSLSSDKISFEYMLLSEEYGANYCKYSDGLAFFIKKTGTSDGYVNFAKIPGTSKPVTVSNINNTCGDPTYFDGFVGLNTPQISPTNFYGQTKVMTATADIEIGATYHIKIVVADVENSLYDSAVFLKSGSFVGNKYIGPDHTMANNTALCTTGSYTIDATPDPATQGTASNFIWYKDGLQILSGNYPKYTVNYTDPGYYEVEILLNSGCKLKGHLTVEQQILPVISTTAFNDVCDDDLDGNTEVYLNLYTSQIINNLSPDYNYDIRYYDNSPIDINNPTESPITKLEFSGDTKTIYLWVKPGQCDPVLTPITFNKNTLSQFHISVSAKTFEVCDDELKGKKEVVISSPDFINQLIPAGYDGSLSFYKTIAGAKSKDSNQFLGNNPTITLDAKQPLQTYYVRFHQLGACDNVAPISFEFKQPKESTVLKDTLICRGTYTDLDAGAGFTSYHWSNGENTQSIKNVPAGDYWVDLSFNDCVYRQFVKVSEPAELLIDNVLIEGNKITIQVSNGIPPYRYFLDGAQQSSNKIENVATGKHTVEVRDQCGFVIQNFSIIAIKNLITPNGDGFNDVIDYSDLMTKIDPVLEVYDRNGQLVFKGNQGNKFSWDGKLNGRDLPTSSYWYILEWNESGNPIRVKNTGWILLKNRNSY